MVDSLSLQNKKRIDDIGHSIKQARFDVSILQRKSIENSFEMRINIIEQKIEKFGSVLMRYLLGQITPESITEDEFIKGCIIQLEVE